MEQSREGLQCAAVHSGALWCSVLLVRCSTLWSSLVLCGTYRCSVVICGALSVFVSLCGAGWCHLVQFGTLWCSVVICVTVLQCYSVKVLQHSTALY